MSMPTKKMKNISPAFSVDKEYTLLFYVLFSCRPDYGCNLPDRIQNETEHLTHKKYGLYRLLWHPWC